MEGPEEALALLERGEEVIEALVLSPALDDPISVAQRAHAFDRDIAVVIVAPDEALPRLARALQFAPFIGEDVTCRPAESIQLLGAEVADAAARTRQRHRFRRTLAAANERLATLPPAQLPVARYLGQLLEQAPLGVLTVDGNGLVAGWNRRAVELFGGTQPLIGADLASSFVERDRVSELVTAAARGRELPPEVVTRPGGWFLELSASALRARSGESGALVMLQDVTERVRAERRLRLLTDASALLASSLDYEATLARAARLAIPALADFTTVDVVDEDGAIRRVGFAAADDAKEELLRELQERYPPTWESRQPAAETLRRREPFLLGEVSEEVLRQRCYDQRHFEIMSGLAVSSALAVPLVARDELLGAITFCYCESGRQFHEEDVTLANELGRRAAAAIDNARLYRRAEARAQAARVLAAVGDGVFLVDGDGVVREWNPAAAAVTGLAAPTVVGRPVAQVLPGWASVAARVPVSDAPGVRAETLPFDVGARELWLSISGVRVADGTVYAFRDVTEERRLEQIRADFVATVSHELRTPLAAVYGAVKTLERPDLTLDDGSLRALYDVIGRESERLARNIDDILLASHLDSGHVPVDEAAFDPVEVVQDAVAALGEPERIRVVAGDGLPPALGEPERVRQVLGNLLENAVKYSGEDSPIEVRVEPRGHAVRFSVRDEGVGIPAHEQSRIFEKFYRLDPDLSRGVTGTGLGLYICRELVERMNGRIWVDSREGAGSTFSFELPAAA